MRTCRSLRIAGAVVLFAQAALGNEPGPAPAGPGSGDSAAGTLCGLTPSREKLFLPLRATEVRLDVTAGLLAASVAQRFVNDTAYALEAVYVFPLPARAAVTDMELRIGDRVIRSEVRERGEAKATYEAAKKEGKRTALVEQERPNVFTTSVANFLPGETVEVRFTYTEALEYRRGVYTVNFPAVVGPRFIPFDFGPTPEGEVQAICAVEDAARVCPPLLHPRVDSRHRLRIEARIRGLPVEEARSGTHAVRVEREGDDVRVSLAGEVAVPDSDFNLQILLRRAESPQAFCAASVTNGAAFALLTILPPTARERDAATPPAPRDAIFLVDTSGSMAGESVGQARAGLKRCLRMLRPCDRFAIVRFADAFSFFAPDLLTATPDRLAAAEAYVDGLAADGGTMMHPALACALGLPDDGRAARLVIFLTDGCVGNENELMKLVAGRLGRARLFAFGIGSAPNEFLLRRVAEMGRGQAAFIRSQEDVGEAIADLFRTLDEPALTDVSVAWRDARGIAVPGVESYPDPPPDCFRDRPVQVVARLPAGFAGTVEVRGRRGGGDVSFEHAVDTAAAAGHPAVDRLFGAGRVNDLSYRELLAPSPEERKKLRDEIVATALRHRLVTAYTSRVAVEERIHRAPDGQLVTARVPTVLPKGWSASEFFPTASCEWLRILAGAILLGAGGGLGLLRGRRRAGP